jgi:hypothetical protein
MKITIRLLASLALTLVVASCSSDRTTAPASLSAPTAAPSGDLLGGLLGTVTNALGLTSVNGLQRTTPLASPITVAKTIGSTGGTLSIPQAGITVTIPAGALSAPTLITMTARSGSLVAYDFAPHGITFARPLRFSQSLNGTNASILSAPFLHLGYYADDSLLGATGGLVSELLSGTVNLLTWTFTSNITHFSGYMVSCGRDD